MILEQTIEKLIQMRLIGMANSLRERSTRADHKDLSPSEFFGLIIDDEWIYRENRQDEGIATIGCILR